MSPSNNQGSLWRRWDPHVHMPGTLLNDQFGDTTIDEALTILAAQVPPIEAIGVTDYFTTESYKRVEEALTRGVAPSIRFAFPNVELRLDNRTKSNRAVNIHLLVAPTETDALDQFLAGLEFNYNGVAYRATPKDLTRLGSAYSANHPSLEDPALRIGITQFKVNFQQLHDKLMSNKWAQDNVLVAVAGGERDGTSGLRVEGGSFDALRQSIESFTDIVFSATPQQADFWKGQGAANPAKLDRIYGGPKLCLHGSDAHATSRLGKPDFERFSWVKGGLDFETLRLACLSPETRGHIGKEAPASSTAYGRITRVAVSNEQWFRSSALDINPGLVAIIGARGSGKTALADLIAAAAGSKVPFDNNASFVRRAGNLLHETSAEVSWSKGEKTSCDFRSGDLSTSYVPPVRYLSQQFVEDLCAADGVTEKLLAEIERVIYASWPVHQRQGAQSFRELLEIRLTSARTEQRQELESVFELSKRVNSIRQRKRTLDQRKEELNLVRSNHDDITKEITKLTEDSDESNTQRHELVAKVLQDRRIAAQAFDRRLTALEALQRAAKRVIDQEFPRWQQNFIHEHSKAALENDEWAAFAVSFAGDVTGVVATALEQCRSAHEQLVGEAPDRSAEQDLDALDEPRLRELSVLLLEAEASRLEELIGLDEARAQDLTRLTKSAAELKAAIDSMQEEIGRDEAASTDELVAQRLDRYRSYFRALLTEEEELRKLYAPIDKVLKTLSEQIANSGSIAKLRFAVRRVVDLDAWATRGEALLDLRTEGPFRGEGQLAQVARQDLLEAWEIGDAKKAAEAIEAFAAKHEDDLWKHRRTPSKGAASADEWENRFSLWLYGTDHISLRYSLEYDGLSIERLSPGSRGIVLLLLYLAVDLQETGPLIIDQPEENLDPESVHSELVGLFRLASERRQIIMVTHNANLVVNTDVDQVIVASCGSLQEGRLPEINYNSGGLEDPSIRRSVCKVLEGGAEAFRERARRLGLDLLPYDEDADP